MLLFVFLVSYLGPTRDSGLVSCDQLANLIPIFQFLFKIKMNSYSATRHQR